GLYAGFDDWEYPIWPMLWSRGFHGVVRNINPSEPLPRLCGFISARRSVPDAFMAQWPVHIKHIGLDMYWSEEGSRWVQLTQPTAQGPVPVSPHESELTLDPSRPLVILRTGRPGVLEMRATPGYRTRPGEPLRRGWLPESALVITPDGAPPDRH